MHRATARSTRHHSLDRAGPARDHDNIGCHDVDGYPSDAHAARYFVTGRIGWVRRIERIGRIGICPLVLTW